MTMFFISVYIGGVAALPKTKIGFWNRLFWPGLLGIALHEWAIKTASTDLDGNPKDRDT